MNILEKANEIINNRAEEKERQYGPINKSMEKAADISSIISGKKISTEDVFIVLIALKLSRHSYGYKEDSLLDAVAYLGGLNNYLTKDNE